MAVSFQTGAEPIPGYRLLDRLGSGGFGEVWRCEAPGGIFKAVKVIHGDLRHKDNESYRFAEQEMKSLMRVKTVRHPYLLALDRFDVVEGRLVIVMEMADCNLWDRFRECRTAGLPGIPRDELLRYMFEAAEVLDLMYDKHQLQHLDIKPQNLFLLYNHVKVADFGQVKDLEKHVAQVTGGITPVYAAPETFDGFVSRYCDQYSLACVYQELLTGVRPFDGNSMNQLLLQHLQYPPNLNPVPEAERPALARALSKKGEHRFPSVTAMVTAIRDGVCAAASVPAGVPVPSNPSSGSGPQSFASPAPEPPRQDFRLDDDEILPLSVLLESTPSPRAGAETPGPADRTAPPEQTGPGPLRPAVVIGLGYAGRRVLQRLVATMNETFGPGKRVPVVRTVYLDTDPESLAEAVTETGEPGLAPLPSESVIPAPLNRAAYYLRPRSNGRSVIEGWFDPAVLYRMSRTPSTTGLRCLGRLALCDHSRAVMQKIQAEIDEALAPEALETACAATGLDPRTNRPRVYVVAGLGGGTGSGMAIDLAYAVRSRLRRIGYAEADLVGVLLTPSAGAAVGAQARANTFAALTELNHYSQADTEFNAPTDDADCLLRDVDPPFSRTVLLPGFDHPEAPSVTQTNFPTRSPRGSGTLGPRGSGSYGHRGSRRTPGRASGTGSLALRATQRTVEPPPSSLDRDPTAAAAEFLRLELFTPVGRVADEARGKLAAPATPSVAAVGMKRIGWPRSEVVRRTARIIAPVLIGHWVDPQSSSHGHSVTDWAQEQWQRLGLGPEPFTERLIRAVKAAVGVSVNDLIHQTITQFSPKGWLSRLPDPTVVSAAVDRFVALFGSPRNGPNRQPTALEQALTNEAEVVLLTTRNEFMSLVPTLLDTPAFRLAGAEEVVRHLLNLLHQARTKVGGEIEPHEQAAAAAYDHLAQYVAPQKGMKKVLIEELSAALRGYPTEWYQALIGRRLAVVYNVLIDVLTVRLSELSACRIRVKDHHTRMRAEVDTPAPPNPADLLPVACPTIDDAVQKYLGSLNDDDLNALEQRLQERIARQTGGVYELCLNSAEGPAAMLRIIREVTWEYLNERMGEVDLYGMLKARVGSSGAVGQALESGLIEATPGVVGRGPWASHQVTAFGAPSGPGGEPIGRQAVLHLPPESSLVSTPDEVVFYREYPQVPLSALGQFGPAWSAAYQQAADVSQSSPHTRLDVTRWVQVDG